MREVGLGTVNPAQLATELLALAKAAGERRRHHAGAHRAGCRARAPAQPRARRRMSPSIALKLAKPLGIAPRELADELAEGLRALDGVASVDVAGPGLHQRDPRRRCRGRARPHDRGGGRGVRPRRSLRRGHDQPRVRVGQPRPVRCTSAGSAGPPSATRSPASSRPRVRPSRASTTSTTTARRSTGSAREPPRELSRRGHAGGRLRRRLHPRDRRASDGRLPGRPGAPCRGTSSRRCSASSASTSCSRTSRRASTASASTSTSSRTRTRCPSPARSTTR